MREGIIYQANTGNSVANYTAYIEECERCDGTGEVYYDDFDVERISQEFEIYDYRGLIKLYRQWQKNNGRLPCPECDGEGKYEIWK